MKNELPIQESHKQRSLDEAFAQKPHVRARLLEIAGMIEQAVSEGCTAHEAENRAIKQIRKLGNDVLTDWAKKSALDACRQAQAENSKLIQYGKKNS